MSYKYYAIRKGRKTGIIKDWETTKESINGFSGAEYHGFNDINIAKKYLGNVKIEAEKNVSTDVTYKDFVEDDGFEPISDDKKITNVEEKADTKQKEVIVQSVNVGKPIDDTVDNGTVNIYVSSSANTEKSLWSFGVYTHDRNNFNEKLYDFGNTTFEKSKLENIGEVMGTIQAIKWAICARYRNVNIYFNFAELRDWIYQEDEPNCELGKFYKHYYETSLKDFINVDFIKINNSDKIFYEKSKSLSNTGLNLEKKTNEYSGTIIKNWSHYDFEQVAKLKNYSYVSPPGGAIAHYKINNDNEFIMIHINKISERMLIVTKNPGKQLISILKDLDRYKTINKLEEAFSELFNFAISEEEIENEKSILEKVKKH